MRSPELYNGPVAWMARNPVAANLLMIVVMLSGLIGVVDMRKEVFPTFPTEIIRITVPYPGSSPTEVEEGILIKVEEAIQDLEDIKEISSEARENVAVISVQMQPRTDMAQALNKVTTRVNAIASFPKDAEKPVIEEVLAMSPVINLSVAGDISEHDLSELAYDIKDELLATGVITQIELVGVRDYEMSIEISDIVLRQYDLSFDQLVQLVRSHSNNLPGGNLRTTSGTITLRSQGQAYSRDDYAAIPVITRPDGTRLKLGDIAQIRDGFTEQPILSRLNGQSGVRLSIKSIGQQDVLKIARVVKDYVAKKQTELPEGVSLRLWHDMTKTLKGRISLLLRNAAQGGLLVLIILSLFLKPSMALWVSVGVPFSFLGTLYLMGLPTFDYSINIASLFGFLLVLGIVVDDAIVTGESAYTYLEREKQGLDSIIRGTKRVSTATVFGMLTTVIAFMPAFFMTSWMGRFMTNIAFAVIGCLILSLIETKLILPSHLRHMRVGESTGRYARFQKYFENLLTNFAKNIYRPALEQVLAYRYLGLAGFIAIFIIVSSMIPAGFVRFVFVPDVPSDSIRVTLRLPASAPYQLTHEYAKRIEQAAKIVNEKYRQQSGDSGDAIVDLETLSQSDTQANLWASLTPSEDRNIDSVMLAKWWREEVGPLPGVKELTFLANTGPGGDADLDIALESDNLDELRQASSALQEALQTVDGVVDIRDTFGSGAPEIDIRIKPAGQLLGLGQAEIARQVRQAFFGAEIQRFQRGQQEVRTYARLPQQERNSLKTLQDLWINLSNGERVPFTEVAEANFSTGISTIHRINRERVVDVQTGIEKKRVEPGDIISKLQSDIMPELLAQFPGLSYRFSGQLEDQQKDTREIKLQAVLVLIMIFAALAIPLRSYTQPLYIMSAIPFAYVGAVLGHWIMGHPLSMLSMIGITALAGVVVNDSLVLVDFINQKVAAGEEKLRAVVDSGQARFRAVTLTSLTTFFGLLPIQMETSIQAQFIKPMAISVGFGILFATVVTLFLVPTLFFIAHDATCLWQRMRNKSGVKTAESSSSR